MRYTHTQTAPLYLILVVVAITQAVIGSTMLRAAPAAAVALWSAGAIVIALAFCFKELTVRDEGDHLLIHFGPIPLFRKRIAYAEITEVEAGRSSVLDGWGIHYGPGGWIWNLWGLDCVIVRMGRKTLRVGTDDAAGLTGFVRGKIGR